MIFDDKAVLAYEELRALIDATPNTPGGIRVTGRLVDKMRATSWPVTIKLNPSEVAEIRGWPVVSA